MKLCKKKPELTSAISVQRMRESDANKAVVKGKCEVLTVFLFNAAPEAVTIESHPVKRIKIDIPPVTSQISQEKAFEMLARMGVVVLEYTPTSVPV